MTAATSYADFLETKRRFAPDCGFECPPVNPQLYDFQQELVRWAVRKGRAAIWADCGLGKTAIQLEWAKHITRQTERPCLILAPLAVSQQTAREGEKFGVAVNVVRGDTGATGPVIEIANYEMLGHFKPETYGAIVLDESSILKNYSGKIRREITDFAKRIPYRLACTATPAPNDLDELINHSDFLGVMRGKEVIALYFTQDGNTTHKWRLKRYAERDFWRWMATWARAVRYPSDLGFEDGAFVLPELKLFQHTVDGHIEGGFLFPVEAHTLPERRQARRESIDDRVGMCADLVNADIQPWIVWCNLNTESQALTKAIPDAVEVTGSDSNEVKQERLLGFIDGKYRVLVSKPSIAGFGLNMQHCARMAFVGLSDSFEQYYQAIRRCWRFGQTKPVHAHIIVAETEGAVVANIERKERQAAHMMAELVKHMKEGA